MRAKLIQADSSGRHLGSTRLHGATFLYPTNQINELWQLLTSANTPKRSPSFANCMRVTSIIMQRIWGMSYVHRGGLITHPKLGECGRSLQPLLASLWLHFFFAGFFCSNSWVSGSITGCAAGATCWTLVVTTPQRSSLFYLFSPLNFN